MPESPNQASSRQRRANWVALRTLRQLPKAVGETAAGEPVYEVRSVRLLLDATAANFVRLTECARCGRELAGAPVLTPADLDRPLRPMICTDCIRKAGVSTVWDSEGGGPGERPASLAPAASGTEPTPEPVAEPADARAPERVEVLEGHLRAVTDRVNELGRVARAHQAELRERAKREEASASGVGEELAALRAEVQRLADLRAESPPVVEAAAGAGALAEEVGRLAELLDAQRAELARVSASLSETQQGHAQLALACQVLEGRLAEAVDRLGDGPVDLAKVEELMTARLAEATAAGPAPAPEGVDLAKVDEMIAGRVADAESRLAAGVPGLAEVEALIAGRVGQAESRLAAGVPDLAKVDDLIAGRVGEAEKRLSQQLAGQRGDLDRAIHASVAAFAAPFERAKEELAGGQAVLEERIEALAGQVAKASSRLQAVLDRLAALEAAAYEEPEPPPPALEPASPEELQPGSLLDSLDRQLDAAARRLAARAQAGAGRRQA